ncbi:hypothetical protein PAPHI01_0391 [Pancytospora philotis]|nr:hypothetical protein PAPHI01_0391 [Pancytospora philotis]
MKVHKRVVRLVSDAEAMQMMGKEGSVSEATIAGISNAVVRLKELGLTEFEAYNIVNVRPANLACLQVIVEEMVDRLSEEQMAEVLEIVKRIE